MGHIQPAPGTEQYNYQLAHWGDDVRAQNIAGSLITAFAATILVTTRIWCQLKYNHKLFAADWLILVAWPFAAIEAVCTVLPICLGMGQHQLRVVMEDHNPPYRVRTQFITAGYLGPIVWALALTFIKLSLLFYYRQLFLIHQRVLKYTIWALLFYVVAWGIGTTFTMIFKCTPISYNWTAGAAFYGLSPGKKGKCQPELAHLAAPTILNTVSDVALIVLPAVVLMQLQMSTQRKLGLIALFSVGLFTVGVGVARIVFLFQVTNEEDFTWNNISAVTWSCIEVCTGVVCACIPPSAPLFKDALQASGLRTRTRPAYGDAPLGDGERLYLNEMLPGKSNHLESVSEFD